MSYEQDFLFSLLLTLTIEVPVVFVFLKYVYKKYKNIQNLTIIFVGVLVSVLTLPYLWFVLPAFVSDKTVFMVLGESLVVLVEALIYYKLLKLKLLDAFVVSLVANTVSIILGLLFR